MRNNVIFGDGRCGIEQSALFLLSYHDAFQEVNGKTEQTNTEGKQSVLYLTPSTQLVLKLQLGRNRLQVGQN